MRDLVDWGAAGVDYAAWDLARALHDDCEDLPELSDRRAFVQEYLATLHDEPPAPSSVNALVNDIQYFTVCDNYLRGFLLVERAHAAAKDVDAADLLSKAAMRLRQARAQRRRGLVMCVVTCESSRRGDFFASVLFFRLLQVALAKIACGAGTNRLHTRFTCGSQSISRQIFVALPVHHFVRPWDGRTGSNTRIGLLHTPPSCHNRSTACSSRVQAVRAAVPKAAPTTPSARRVPRGKRWMPTRSPPRSSSS